MKRAFLLLATLSFAYGKLTSFQTERDGRIMGGTIASIEDFPYQTSLQIKNSTGSIIFFKHICGASIITRHWLVSAAHCIQRRYASMLVIRAGTANRYNGGSLHKVVYIKIHPDYDVEIDFDCDISLLNVKEGFVYGATIQPIRLPKEYSDVANGTFATVVGWGTSEVLEVDSARDELRQVTVPVITNAECISKYGEDFITSNMMCAGYETGGKDACLGDSGGPLTAQGVQIGIVSWGDGCARLGYPGVYTRVSEFTDWIINNTSI